MDNMDPGRKQLFESGQCCESNWYRGLSDVVSKLASSWDDTHPWEHGSAIPMPYQEAVLRIIDRGRRILFPGYFTHASINADNLEYYIGQELCMLFEDLSEQIDLAFCYQALAQSHPSDLVQTRGRRLALAFVKKLPSIKSMLMSDIEAAMVGDPAARSESEVIFCYPGFLAISIYRMAHELWRLGIPFIPRIMTEHAHSLTGIDIHPGATVGRSFFIDHGTGVVVGETTIIGDRVRIYQGVTLGALSVPKKDVPGLRNRRRHPTVEDDVIIYSNSTILGGETTIGARSVIGGNIWLTESVPPDTRVILKRPRLIYKGRQAKFQVEA